MIQVNGYSAEDYLVGYRTW